MTGPDEPQYPDPQYPQYPAQHPQPYPQSHPYPQPYPQPAPPRPALAARLGVRVLRRPEARAGTSVAAAGAGLALLGILVWAGGYLFDGLHVDFDSDTGVPTVSGESRRFLGAGLFLAIALLGYALTITRRVGPWASAGVFAGAAGVPLALLFVSASPSDTFRGDFPVNLDLVSLLSIAVWLVSYFALPGTRGRAVYLGLAAVVLASYVGYKASGDSVGRATAEAVNGQLSSSGTSTIGAVGLVFGLGYYAIAAFLDRRGRAGAAIGLVFAGFVVTASGIAALAPDAELAGTGVILLLVGTVLTIYAGRFGRRFTAWIWAAGAALGVVLIVAKISPDNYTAAGISLLVIGAVVAAVAAPLSAVLSERPDVDGAEAATAEAVH